MVYDSPGSARDISGRRTGLNPRPISMSFARVNHGGRLATGNWAKPTDEDIDIGQNGRAVGAASTCGRGGSAVGWCCLCRNAWVAMRMEELFLMVPVSN